MSNEIYTFGVLIEGYKDLGDGGMRIEFEISPGYTVRPCLKVKTQEYKYINIYILIY